MATLQELESALVNAHNAGDADAARKLAVAVKAARADAVNLIPGLQVPGTETPAPAPSLGERIVGAGETALALGTGATGGTVGTILGAGQGLAETIAAGDFGTEAGADRIEQAAMRGADALTYAPRTPAGQQMTASTGQVLAQAIPIGPLAGEMAALGRAAQPAAEAAGVAGRAAAAAVPAGARRVQAAVQPVVSRAVQAVTPGERRPTPGTQGSVGAAGTDMATQRIATAESMPVPIKLTQGQATRDAGQLRFERETAKDPSQGAPLRERNMQQNAALTQNLEKWIDDSGATTLDNVTTGNAAVDALTRMKASEKAKVRVLYKAAEKAGDLEKPVSTEAIVQFLKENESGKTTAPVLGVIENELVRLKGAARDADGSLVPGEVSVNNLEALRKVVNKFVKDDGNDQRLAGEFRGVHDAITEGAGGKAYQAARAARIELANKFENRAVVADLLANRKRMKDPKVAAENVFNRVILNGSQDDVAFMRKLLQAGGENGTQAWTELRGATLRHLRDQALSNTATDSAGNAIFSAAKFDREVRRLDQNGRLDIVLGKREAQAVRDLNDIAKYVQTVPPGVENTSNTASVLIAALAEAGASGSMFGLPVPVLTGMKVLSARLKDRRIQRRIDEALRNRAPAKPTQAPPPPKNLH